MRDLVGLLRAPAGDRGDAASGADESGGAVRADRGDLQPGQPGRRLYRHDAGGLPRLRRGDCRSRRLAAGPRGSGRRSSRAQRLAGPARGRGDGAGRGDGRGLCRAPASARSISTARWPARAIRAPLPDAIVAERAARLCAVAEARMRGAAAEPPVYVIGTEVPVPGGAARRARHRRGHHAAAARATIDDAPASVRRRRRWRRLAARDRLVVQPGVEFDHRNVVDYCAGRRARSAE